jgi:hypothetical protein
MDEREQSSVMFFVILPLHAFTILLGFVLMTIYMLLALKNEKLEEQVRLLWAILLFVGGPIAMPVYFFKYVLPASDDEHE